MNDFNDIFKENAAKLLLDENPDHLFEIISEYPMIFTNWLICLKNNCPEDKLILADEIIGSTVKYFEPAMTDMITCISEAVKIETWESMGMKCTYCPETGEPIWS